RHFLVYITAGSRCGTLSDSAIHYPHSAVHYPHAAARYPQHFTLMIQADMLGYHGEYQLTRFLALALTHPISAR
ncbi:hypothetical protein, partial [Aetokthonos hydrillicola]|uniref:hypothetical protein n=1 Tax=Aetokthonos hydrillicola TaxID=1550245 RepID=UPI001ABAB595